MVLLVDERQPLFLDDLEILSRHARIFSHPGEVDYRTCHFIDAGGGYTYTAACGGTVGAAARGLQQVQIGSEERLYNYYEATGGQGTIVMEGVSAFRREEPLATALPPSVGRPPRPAYCEHQLAQRGHGTSASHRPVVRAHGQ